MNFLVVITTMVGFCMASSGRIDWLLLLHTLIGTALTAACASVLNQLIERRLRRADAAHADRPVAAGRIAPARGDRLRYRVWHRRESFISRLAVNLLTALLGLATRAQLSAGLHADEAHHDPEHGDRRGSRRDPAGDGLHRGHSALSLDALALFASCSSGRCRTSWRSRSCTARLRGRRDSRCCPASMRTLSLTSRMIVLYRRGSGAGQPDAVCAGHGRRRCTSPRRCCWGWRFLSLRRLLRRDAIAAMPGNCSSRRSSICRCCWR